MSTNGKNRRQSKTALLLVDIQYDFLPGGALEVKEGNEILSPLRELMERDPFGLYVATQDWHPPGHVSFASSHSGREPMDTMTLYGHEQVLWPDHCVQGTKGAELAEGLPWDQVGAIVRKGTDPACDSYSGFRNNWNEDGERPPTGLDGYLKARGIEDVYVAGLARDVCARWTALDAAAEGFRTRFLWDATRPVDRESDADVREELKKAGVKVVNTGDVGNEVN